tara:strand:+ start:72 stop:332 length:261 start_codon:yes stop_codon:yes gene_type:complete
MTYSKKEQMVMMKILLSRVNRWKHVGDACTEKEWIQLDKDLTIIQNCIDGLERQKRASLAPGMSVNLMKLMNEMWHKYKIKKSTTI